MAVDVPESPEEKGVQSPVLLSFLGRTCDLRPEEGGVSKSEAR